jgi:uncharacterized protein YceH (UPF0502 family)
MKYSHLMGETMELDLKELAVMCVLMLRGPQTLAEIRTRTERLAAFDSTEAVEATLNGLMARAPAPLAVRLPRQPGQKELRYSHLLSGELAVETPAAAPTPPVAEKSDRISALEAATEELRKELTDIKRQLEELRKQFE